MKTQLSGFFLLILLYSCNVSETSNPASVGDGNVFEVSTTYKPSDFIKDDRVAQIRSLQPKLHQLFEEYLERRKIPGIAYGIVVDDQLVIDSTLGYIDLEAQTPPTSHSCFRIASMTKSFTAMGIMKLMEDDRLSLHDPVVEYIPEIAKIGYLTSDATTITIENLLTMTAGFPEDNPWGDRQLDEPNEMLSQLLSDKLSMSNPPAHTYEYSNTGYAILGMIISRVSGIPYQEYLHQNIIKPLGMVETYWEYSEVPEGQLVSGYDRNGDGLVLEPLLHDGSYGAMGGLITSISDFSKYVSFHLSAWPPRSDPDKGPVKRSSLRKMHQAQYVRLIPGARDWNDEPCPVMAGYGYGLGVSESCKGIKRVSHGGALPGFGSNYVFYPDLGIGLMAFCNVTYTSPWPYVEILKLLFDELDLKPRQLPTSDILLTRQQQIVELLKSWDPELEKAIIAENLYLDEDREKRIEEVKKLLEKTGPIQSIGELQPRNQLRGSFDIIAEKDTIEVFFTLSPEPEPKVQRLDFSTQ